MKRLSIVIFLLCSLSANAAIKFAWEGDSQTEYEAGGRPWSWWLTNTLYLSPLSLGYNGAQSGRLTADMAARYSTYYTPVKPTGGDTGYYYVYGGTVDYDCAYGCVAWWDTLANLSNCWKSAKADGWKVVAFTVPAAEPGYFTTGETNRTNLNSKIKASSAQYDHLIDLDAYFGANSATNVVADHLHWNTNAHARIAALVYQSVFASPAGVVRASVARVGRIMPP